MWWIYYYSVTFLCAAFDDGVTARYDALRENTPVSDGFGNQYNVCFTGPDDGWVVGNNAVGRYDRGCFTS